jgi:hypothetical protein
MSLLAQAKADIEQITSDPDGFSASLTFTAPDGVTTAAIRGLFTEHHLGFDTDGRPMNSRNSHISFSEKFLTDLSYPIRNAAGKVFVKDHKVRVVVSGLNIDRTYTIRENFPDETLGFIVCILGDFQ